MTSHNQPLRVVFAGTPDFAATVLAALLETSQTLVACYTQPDRPAGRGRKLTPSPVKVLAESRGIPVYQPLNFKQTEDVEALAALQPDLMIVVAYGLILPQRVLDIPRLGCINVHASLLPRWRGAAPIQRALIEGDAETGITLMQMEAGLDTGPMLSKVTTPITAQDTSSRLHDRLAALGAQAMAHLLEHIAAHRMPPADAQDNALATYSHKLTKEEGQIDWTQSATVLARKIRGLNPWPVAYSSMQGETVRLWNAEVLEEGAQPVIHRQTGDTNFSEDNTTDGAVGDHPAPGTVITADKRGIHVATGQGILLLTELQLPGGKTLATRDILNSRAALFATGNHFEGGTP